VADRVLDFARSWWPVAVFLLPVLVVQSVWSARYDVAGHAADHLQSATPVFPMDFLSTVLWALPGRGRRDPLHRSRRWHGRRREVTDNIRVCLFLDGRLMQVVAFL
jgi:hypothetical protein